MYVSLDKVRGAVTRTLAGPGGGRLAESGECCPFPWKTCSSSAKALDLVVMASLELYCKVRTPPLCSFDSALDSILNFLLLGLDLRVGQHLSHLDSVHQLLLL